MSLTSPCLLPPPLLCLPRTSIVSVCLFLVVLLFPLPLPASPAESDNSPTRLQGCQPVRSSHRSSISSSLSLHSLSVLSRFLLSSSPLTLSFFLADCKPGHVWSSYVDSTDLDGQVGRGKFLGDEEFDFSKEKLQVPALLLCPTTGCDHCRRWTRPGNECLLFDDPPR